MISSWYWGLLALSYSTKLPHNYLYMIILPHNFPLPWEIYHFRRYIWILIIMNPLRLEHHQLYIIKFIMKIFLKIITCCMVAIKFPPYEFKPLTSHPIYTINGMGWHRMTSFNQVISFWWQFKIPIQNSHSKFLQFLLRLIGIILAHFLLV